MRLLRSRKGTIEGEKILTAFAKPPNWRWNGEELTAVRLLDDLELIFGPNTFTFVNTGREKDRGEKGRERK